MKLFVDASAMIAIIEDEPDRAGLTDKLRAASTRLWSALSCWEAVSGMQSGYGRPVAVARERVAAVAYDLDFKMVPIAANELGVALDAYERYGKGRHPAKLNFGDCFAYACAKTNNARLLYKGNDFIRTDLA